MEKPNEAVLAVARAANLAGSTRQLFVGQYPPQHRAAAAAAWDEVATYLPPAKPSTPLPSTPMCDAARALPTLRARLRHYRACDDARCQERLQQGQALAKGLAQGMRKGT
jgi:hypothetical protein